MNFRPLGDLILVKPDPTPERRLGSLFLPDGGVPHSHQAGEKKDSYRDTHFGTVVAVGPGDRHRPFGTFACSACYRKHVLNPRTVRWECGCVATVTPYAADRWNAGRHKMHTKVGDRVVYPRRPNSPAGDGADVKIAGELYVLFNEQQSALCVVK